MYLRIAAMYAGLSPSSITCLKVFRVKNRLSNIELALSTRNTTFLQINYCLVGFTAFDGINQIRLTCIAP